ncbi:DUF1036 domain-containing protein [Antarcticimicrobium luteum]|uniref:DUF1036 domain-containing protein n=1 Tax=Antarcticimicrobium luteum TaxID=2547397 RepID=A0A4R5UPX3_9RHOB|nr:DUF1036 domain-containing protein [Antarcticimicrobium luteum]TDK41062.1 DUF1036 domain-containing protein [Antarcticimicrobium luteum]
MKAFSTAIAVLCGLAAGPALADLRLCNEASARHSVAVGYKSGDQWMSEGWWNIDPGKCATVISGDLKYRFFYYRLLAKGRRFEHEGYGFCTRTSAFTIEGDKNCADRGYTNSGFRQIDAGDARDFSFSFTDAVSVTEPVEAAPPAAPRAEAAAPAEAPGTWGEPYASGAALFQDCVSETEAPFCTFHADGTKFFVYDDGRTPAGVFRAMRTYLPGTPIEVRGDLEAIHDRTADIVLRRVIPRAYDTWDNTLSRMQGTWYSVDDPNSQFNIIGSELENIYDGAFGAREYLSMRDTCEHFDGGNILVRMDEETGDVMCYSIEELGAFNMLLMYLPRANFHEFRKLD